MSDPSRQRLHDAAIALRRLRGERDELLRREREPIAIVGIGCRFPGGVDSPETFSDLLDQGRDAVTEMDARWSMVGAWPEPETPRWAGLLDDVAHFDPAFFGISPREARTLDPQHRLLLEVAWHALEDAGLPPPGLEGSRSGVFVGACSAEYQELVKRQPVGEADAYGATGNMLSVAAGRLSYTLGWQGPCLTVDTACSSSLVAVHLAIRSLRSRECDLALAGGVNLLLSPRTQDSLARLKALSPDGRCRAFDAGANGFVRGEGCGLVVLRRLSDAVAAGDRIWALLRGSAVNQDGRSTGLTVPNARAQEALLRQALQDARVGPESIGFVETHGTGTPLGDPIEAEALHAVLGGARADGSACWLGAVKTHIGHLEGAAGVAGLIRAALVLNHSRVTPNLHFRTLNPRIRLEGSALRLATEPVGWPAGSAPRLAGVSSFGLSGTNAHVIVAEAPATVPPPVHAARPLELTVLSARSPEALRTGAGRLGAHVASHPDDALGDVALSQATTRAHLEHRLAVVSRSRGELAASLAAVARQHDDPGVARGDTGEGTGKLAILFTGQGAQRPGMGRGLHGAWPVFRDAFDHVATLFDRELEQPLRSVMWADPGTATAGFLDETAYTQPALFTLEMALWALAKSWGLVPSVVAGHSLGEVSAACAAGVLTLEDAARLVAARGRLMQRLPRGGAMVAISASEREILEVMAPLDGTVSIAAVNGPAAVVVSGHEDAVLSVAKVFLERGCPTRRLRVSHAFHSALIEPALDELRRVAESLHYTTPALPIAVNVTGRLDGNAMATPAYWVEQARRPVRFGDSLMAMSQAGVRTFVELGPHPTLIGMAGAALNGGARTLVGMLGEGDETAAALRALARLYVRGASVDWNGVFPSGGRRVRLPTYAFRRERVWVEPTAPPSPTPAAPADWAYAVEWDEAPRRTAKAIAGDGAWLLVSDAGGVAEALAANLLARGERCRRVEPPDAQGAGELDAVLASEPRWRGIAYLRALDAVTGAGDSAADVARRCAEATAPLIAISAAATRGLSSSRVFIVTRGAQATTDVESSDPLQALLWGVGRAMGLEHPGAWGGLIDLDPAGAVEIEALASELVAPDREQQVALRDGRRRVPRLRRRPLPAAAALSISPDSTYLLTGGLGALGRIAARWLVDRGARHLVLTTRRPLPDRATAAEAMSAEVRERVAAVRDLERAGAQVTVSVADLGDESALSRLIGSIDPPVRGVIHTAAAIDDSLLASQSLDRLSSVFAPKVAGAWALHRATAGTPLDFFILFSSASAVIAGPGQASYGGANAFLDGLARLRRGCGLPALSVGWGLWGESRLATPSERRRLESHGILPMPTGPALAVMERLVASGATERLVARIDWSLARDGARAPGRGPLLEDLAPALARDEAQPAPVHGDVLGCVRRLASEVLGFASPDALDPRRGLAEQGMDSLMAVALRDRLQSELGLALPATIAFDHPTVERIANHLDAMAREPAAAAAPAVQEADGDEPIAIVGASCRFPGGETLEAFWDLLDRGGVATTEVPAGRWSVSQWYDPEPGRPGRTSVARGGFLSDVERFDAAFFRIAPREAAAMDPQQRLLLEVGWEALEHAGQDPAAPDASRTGVFVGVGPGEYVERRPPGHEFDGYLGTGTAVSFSAGRLSYFLGLHGPSLAVDTACSSALVAMHLACQSLRSGECDRALAGGVNVLLSPRSFVALSTMRALAPDGRCKPFSAEADGYARGEGCGVVVLKRLSRARADGDRILALIRGSAVNHDGPSSGLTVPNGPAQQVLLRDALSRAGVRAAEIDYVECHGTGTVLGDPIEVGALGAVFGEGRAPERPLVLGAAKANVGHLEPAAGMVGLIKTVLALQHERIPAQPSLGALNPHLDWDALPVVVPRAPVHWPRGERPRRAGVSSFGLSGTNAHLVVEEAPATAQPVGPAAAPVHGALAIVLSARSDAGVTAAATRLLAHLESRPDLALDTLARGLATTRSHFTHRLALVVASSHELRDRLAEVARGAPLGHGVLRGTARAEHGLTALLFTGQGAQRPGMGRALAAEWPSFRDAIERCAALFDPELPRPLLEVMWAETSSPAARELDQTAYTQPALFALGYALHQLWRSFGLRPDLVAGHSVGEIVAAHVAGVFSLEGATRLVAARGRLMQALPAGGAMASIAASLGDVEAELAQAGSDGPELAAVNGPESVVISGAEAPVDRVCAAFAARGVACRRLAVSHAFHSRRMEPMLDAFRAVVESIELRPPVLAIASNVSGRLAGSEIATAAYWVEQARARVRFAESVEALRAAGAETFVEMGPRPVLLGLVSSVLADARPTLLPSLRADGDETRSILGSLAAWYVGGGSVDWTSALPPGPPARDLPTYPWQRERHWFEASPSLVAEGVGGTWPLAGAAIPMPGAARHHVLRVGVRHQPYLAGHLVYGRIGIAGAFHPAIVLAVAADLWPGRALELSSVEFLRVVVLELDDELDLHVVLTPEADGDAYRFEVASAEKGAPARFQVHARGRVAPTVEGPGHLAGTDGADARAQRDLDVEAMFVASERTRVEWTPAWRRLKSLRCGENVAVSEIEPQPADLGAAPIHPVLLDNGVGTALFPLYAGEAGGELTLVPFAMERLRWWREPVGRLRCTAAMRRVGAAGREDVLADFALADDTGVVAEVSGFLYRRAAPDAVAGGLEVRREWLYGLEWRRLGPAAEVTPPPRAWLVLGSASGAGEALASRLRERGDSATLVAELPGSKDGFAAIIDEAMVGGVDAGIVYMAGVDDVESDTREVSSACVRLVHLVQALADRGPNPARALWLVTQAAHALPGEPAPALAQAALAALGRVVATEHPELQCRRIDLRPEASQAEALLREVLAPTAEDEIALRGGARFAPRLARVTPIPRGTPTAVRADSAYLIAGGTGALGLAAARWLLGQGAGEVVLLSRRPLDGPFRDDVAALAETARVRVAAGDVADREAVAQVIRDIDAGPHRLRGVIHAAGVLDDGVVANLTADRISRVLAAKVAGAWNLHELTRDHPLDLFVLYSSAATAFGPGGQAAYVAANGFLGALAERRRGEGRPALAIEWGPFADAGMAASGPATPGLARFTTVQGTAALAALLATEVTRAAVIDFDPRALARAQPSIARRALFSELAAASARATIGDAALRATLASAAPDQRRLALIALIRAQAGAVLRVSPEAIELETPLTALGLDSMMGLEIRNRLSDALGLSLAASLLWQHPSVSQLAGVLAELWNEAHPEAGVRRQEPTAVGEDRPVLRPAPEQRYEPFPLTEVQAAYWIGRQADVALGNVGSHFYMELDAASLDLERLERAWQRLIARHDALRLVVLSDGRQRVLAEVAPYRIATTDLSGQDPADAESGRMALRDRLVGQVLDAGRWPLFEVHVSHGPGGASRIHLCLDTLIVDGRSMMLLLGELVRLYTSGEDADDAPALPVSFRDFVLAEHAFRDSAAYRRSRAYWKERAAVLPPAPALPRGRDLAAIARPRFTQRSARFETTTWERLKVNAAAAGVTPSVTLITAYAEVIGRWSRSRQFTLNLTLFNPPPVHPQIASVVGDFTSLSLLAVEAAAEVPFDARARSNQEQLWRDVDQASAGGIPVLRELARTRGAAEVAPVVFTSLLGAPDPSPALRAAGMELAFACTHTPQIWLEQQVAEENGGLRFVWNAVADVFPDGVLDAMFDAYCHRLAELAEDPAAWAQRAPCVLSREERDQRAAYNATTGEIPTERLHGLVAAAAERHPEATAVIAHDRILSYRELRIRARQVAHRLRERGVGRGALVAIVMEKGWEQVVAVLAILETGAAYVPIDPSQPAERLAYMLKHARVWIALTQAGLDEGLAWPDGVERIAVDGGPVADPAFEWPAVPVRADELAYVIYTSGSTGRPKGVMIDHRGAVNTVLDVNRRYAIGPSDRTLALSSLSFDLSVYDIFGPLAVGGAVVIPHAAARAEPAEWARLLAAHDVTLWNSVPALAQMLVDYADGRTDVVPASLRVVLLSGDWIPTALPERLRRLAPAARIFSLGGATEASIWSIEHAIEPADAARPSVPYGRPLANQQFHVLDQTLEACPTWVPGELYIGGIGLAQGYLHDDEKTRASFIAHPATGARLYRTGDLGRFLPEGEIEFLGREDQQVKIRGHRIELGEIEAALASHPGLAAAVAAARGGAGRERDLVAYVVAAAPALPSVDELRAHAAAKLPDYMRPSIYVFLEALPLSANGKVDRNALPSPEPTTAPAALVPARTPLEEELALLWREVLNLGEVGVFDSFFERGGHSLLATQVMSRVRAAYAVEIPLRALFESPTIAHLAEAIERARALPAHDLPPLVPVSREPAPRLSFAQQRLWFLDQLEPGRSTYNLPTALRVEGALDVGALERAVAAVVARHEPLRTSFPSEGGEARQRIQSGGHPDFAVLDLTTTPVEARAAEADRLLHEEARRPFDLATGPLLRTRLLRIDPETHLLLMTVHHAVADAWSAGVLVGELAALYAAFHAGRPSPLADPAVQYADFAEWQRRVVDGDGLGAQVAYWRERLRDVPALQLPTDRARPPRPSSRGKVRRFEIPAESAAAVDRLARAHGATPFMALLAAFEVLLARYSGQDTFCVGSPIANRTRSGTEPMVGFFVNSLPLRADLSGRPTFAALLARTREEALGAYAHQDVPFERLVDTLQIGRDLSRTPLFQVMFSLENVPAPKLSVAGLTLRSVEVDTGAAKFDLTLTLRETDGRLAGHVEYATDLFDEGTIERMIGHYRTLLDAVVCDPDRPIAQLALVTDAERMRVLEHFNAAGAVHAQPALLHEMVEDQAQRTPDAIAVVAGESSLRYAELVNRAHEIAALLAARGVGPEARVGIALPRSQEMVAALLGVLGAGAAYVPLDPAYPAERLAFMLHDSAASILLTRSDVAAVSGWPAERTIDLDRESSVPAALPFRHVDPENLAYVIYTSGSTGRPKGVAISHASASRFVRWAASAFSADELRGVLFSTSICFDLSVFELFAPLATGGALVLARHALDLAELPAASRVTLVNTVPSAMAELIRLEAVPRSVRTVNLAGEPLWPDLVRKILALGHVERVHDLYGPSEDTTYSTCALRGGDGPMTIGRPIAGTRVYVVDGELQPAPIGVPGEIVVAGDGLARGYLARPGLTADRFVPDPFRGPAGARAYRTGDLGRWREDGTLEFLGRRDHQVKVRGYRIELGEIEAALRERAEIADAVVIVREDTPGDRRLVAYVETNADEAAVAAWRDELRRRLPEHMVPSAIVPVPSLPRHPNGKIDRAALPAPERARPTRSAYAAPATPAEETLVRIWREVLGLDRVGVNDDFFEAGGDSILSIQVVSRARSEGLDLSPRQVFETPTIAGQARAAGSRRPTALRPEPAEGDVPLTPIQRWLLNRDPPRPDHWNQAALLQVGPDLSGATIARAIEAVVSRHDALRLRFVREVSGWRQSYGPPTPAPLAAIDLTPLPADDADAALEAKAAELQASLSLSHGPIHRVALFDLGPERGRRLLWVIHHLAVDALSWRVLLEDLERACRQIETGAAVDLVEPTASYKQWATAAVLQASLVRESSGAALPEPAPHREDGVGGPDTEGGARTVSIALDERETRALLHDARQAYRADAQDVVLAAFTLAFLEWTGERTQRIDVEGHGRDAVADGADYARTVGWFTAIRPVRVAFPADAGPGAALMEVKERLRAVRPAATLLDAPVLFNFLGRSDIPAGTFFRLADERVGPTRDADAPRSHPLEVTAGIRDGGLRLDITYGESRHRRQTIEGLGRRTRESMRTLAKVCAEPGAGGYTPSDFPRADLDTASLEAVFAAHGRNVQAVYPLAPMQAGMFFHGVRAPASRVHFQQLHCVFRGPLLVDVFERAWQEVIARHPSLRTSVMWEGLESPRQIVLAQAAFAIERHDWSAEQADGSDRLRAWLAADRERGIAADQAPLLRVACFAMSGGRSAFAWSFHHLVMDGWSSATVLREVFECYRALRAGERPGVATVPDPRIHHDWLAGRDPVAAEHFWRTALSAITPPAPLRLGRTATAAEPDALEGETARVLSPELTARLRTLGRTRRLTLNTLVQGAWALLLARYRQQNDVVFGVTVSGRPAELPGVDSMVGFFINTVPFRAEIDDAASVAAWLARVQDSHRAIAPHDWAPLSEIQAWSETPAGTALFDTVVVFENYPIDTALQQGFAIEVEEFRAPTRTAYPLSLVVVPGREVSLTLSYDARAVDGTRAALVLRHLEAVLARMAESPDAPLSAIEVLTEEERAALAEAVPLGATTAAAGPFVAPRSALERQLAAVWRDILGLERVGATDDFFVSGGRSLLATRLMARIEKDLGVRLPLGALFEAPTVAGLAARVEQARRAGASSDVPRVCPEPADRFEPFPLTDVQQAYWLGRGADFALGNVSTHIYGEVDAEALDLARLETALGRLVDRHDMLRMVVLSDGRQRVLESVPAYRIETTDLRGMAPRGVDLGLAEIRGRMESQVRDSLAWPMFEVHASLRDGAVRLHVSLDALMLDARSMLLAIQELARLYRTPEAELPALGLTFRDYVLAEHAARDTLSYAESEAYWTARLDSLPAAPALPFARSPESIATPEFTRAAGRLDAGAWKGLQREAALAGITPTVCLLTAFSDVLAAWSRDPRFTLNLTLFHPLHVHADVERIVGDFTTLTLLEVDAGPAEPFVERARRIQRQLWSDIDQSRMSGVAVLQKLSRARGGQPALMPVVFTSTLGGRDMDEVLGELGLRAVHAQTQTPQVWIDHQVAEVGGELRFNWDFVRGLFPAGMVEEMFAAYQGRLSTLASRGGAWQQPCPVLAPAETLSRIAAVNATEQPVADGLLHAPFVARAAEQPDHPAVIAGERTLTYAELDRLSNHYARELRRHGSGPRSLVAVCMDKGWEQVVAVLAVLKAGAAYLPVDPSLPPERFALLLSQGTTLALSQPRVVESAAWPAHVETIALTAVSDPETEPIEATAQPDDLAYVIFTSGSTGVPKGVMIDHRGALNTIVDLNNRYRLGPGDRVLALSALSFDLSVYDVFGTLAAGGTIVVPGEDERREPAAWLRRMREAGVTVWNSVPALMQMLVDHTDGRAERLPPSLRLVLLSGDWIPVSLPDRIRRLAPNAQLMGLGGATEASIWSIEYPIADVDPSWTSIPYGRPLANQHVYVLDHALEPRPTWVPGEIYIGGLGVARGYLGDTEKTRDRFVVHPRTGERLYRTGDWGRYLPDANIEFLGRDDLQVKIQGHRIELGEIEAALGQHPLVLAAAVSAEGDPRTSRVLVAHVVPHLSRIPELLGDGASALQSLVAGGDGEDGGGLLIRMPDGAAAAIRVALRNFLMQKLPAAMIPSEVVLLRALPLSANGKVDRKALPRLGTPAAPRTHVAPSTDVEAALLEIWCEQLGPSAASIGVEDSFFEIGGNSLLATQVMTRIRAGFGIEMPLRDLFETGTVRGLAERIENTRWIRRSGGEAPATSEDREAGAI